MLLTLKKAGSFMKEKTTPNGTVKARRFCYSVSGDKASMEQYKIDIETEDDDGRKKFPNGEFRDGEYLYYSWEVFPIGCKMKRSEKSAAWYPDIEYIDELETIVSRSPMLAKTLGLQGIKEIYGITDAKSEDIEKDPEIEKLNEKLDD